jgi:hypothetical protein
MSFEDLLDAHELLDIKDQVEEVRAKEQSLRMGK